MTDAHDHEEFATSTNVKCFDCGKIKEACAMCGEDLHKCEAQINPLIPRGYRVVDEFPDYMVNSQATVRHIKTNRYCMLVRVSKSGGAMINLIKNGKKYTKAAQEIRDAAFPPRTE